MTEATLSPEFLARMDEAIAEEFERSSRLRKILPAEVDMPHARYGVTIPRVEDDKKHASASANTDVLRPPITLSREVKIAARQLEDLDLVLNLVRDATKRVCVVEDQVIAYGGLLSAQIDKVKDETEQKTEDKDKANPSKVLQGVRIHGLRPSTEALMGPGTALTPAFPTPLVEVDPDPDKKPKRGKTLRAIIQQAVAKLDARTPSFAAPYAAALGPLAWSDYVPADDDYDKGAIAAALQSRKIAVVSGLAMSASLGSGIAWPTMEFDTTDPPSALRHARELMKKLVDDSAHRQTATFLKKLSDRATRLLSEIESSTTSDPGILTTMRTRLASLLEIEADAFLSVFSCDPVDLDLVRVRRPWGSVRGYDEHGNVRFVIEDQFLLRVKRAEAIFAVWLTDRDGDRVAEVQNLPIEVAD